MVQRFVTQLASDPGHEAAGDTEHSLALNTGGRDAGQSREQLLKLGRQLPGLGGQADLLSNVGRLGEVHLQLTFNL